MNANQILSFIMLSHMVKFTVTASMGDSVAEANSITGARPECEGYLRVAAVIYRDETPTYNTSKQQSCNEFKKIKIMKLSHYPSTLTDNSELQGISKKKERKKKLMLKKAASEH